MSVIMEMYAGRVAWCPLVSRVEYAPRDLLRLEKSGQIDVRTDARPLNYVFREWLKGYGW